MAPKAGLLGGGVSPRTDREALGEFAEAGMEGTDEKTAKERQVDNVLDLAATPVGDNRGTRRPRNKAIPISQSIKRHRQFSTFHFRFISRDLIIIVNIIVVLLTREVLYSNHDKSLMLAGSEFQSLGRAIVKEDEYEEVRWDGIVSIVSWRERVFRLWWEESRESAIVEINGLPVEYEETVERLRISFARSLQKSTRRRSSKLNIPQSTVWEILRKRLKHMPYRLQMLQALLSQNKVCRLDLSRLFQGCTAFSAPTNATIAGMEGRRGRGQRRGGERGLGQMRGEGKRGVTKRGIGERGRGQRRDKGSWFVIGEWGFASERCGKAIDE
ncbi:hypothetical protein ANN_01846 [Periplaneta americana]|uniref:Uncharacterized protein n=1 Tax=Periplaneta americana TaxID=6978 RepID=A0ABQ8TXL8_PERAM|nr:hypothetical protein ANN_01846 [Periplaneta americana]